MLKTLAAAMLVGFPASADGIDSTGVAFAAICAKQYGETEIFDAAFALYEQQNPDGLTAEALVEARKSMLESADTSEIEANPIASSLTRDLCDQARSGLLSQPAGAPVVQVN